MTDQPSDSVGDEYPRQPVSKDPLDDFDRAFEPELHSESVDHVDDALPKDELPPKAGDSAIEDLEDQIPPPPSVEMAEVADDLSAPPPWDVTEDHIAPDEAVIFRSESDTQTADSPEPETGEAISGPEGPVTTESGEADLAIVYVHGMGSSKPGNTLGQFFNPTLDWIKRVATGDHHYYVQNNIDTNLVEGVNILERKRRMDAVMLGPNAEPALPPSGDVDIVAIRKAVLESAATTPTVFVPPYVDVQIQGTDHDTHKVHKKRLVAVEAWWDGEFEPPPFKEVAYWALGVAPCFILRHLAQLWELDTPDDADTISLVSNRAEPRTTTSESVNGSSDHRLMQRILRTARRWASAVIPTILGGLAALAVQWIICLLLVFGAVPFLQKYVKALILKLTSSFGDVLVYVHDGIRSAAIRSTVDRSFQWLFDSYKVKKLIVVGYSLGSVIAYDALNRRPMGEKIGDPEGATLVTLGSPLKRANILLELKRDEQRMSLGIPFAFASLICGVTAFTMVSAGHVFRPTSWVGWVLCITTIGAALGFGLGAHGRPKPSLAGYALSFAQHVAALLELVAILLVGYTILDKSIPGIWKASLIGLIAISMLLLFWSLKRIHESRQFEGHYPERFSPFTVQGLVLLFLILVAAGYGMVDQVICALLASVVLAVMTGANPIEEFRNLSTADARTQTTDSSGLRVSRMSRTSVYVRRKPKFAFATQIKAWHDFWAGSDLVAEFGLSDVRYKRSQADSSAYDSIPLSRRLTNLSMYSRDHSVYQTNREQFVAPLTRLFLEEMNLKATYAPDVVIDRDSWWRNLTGSVRVDGVYEQDIQRAMRTRRRRMFWLNTASTIFMCTMLLFSPSIYRAMGESIVFFDLNGTANQTSPKKDFDASTNLDDLMQNINDAVKKGEDAAKARSILGLPQGVSNFVNLRPFILNSIVFCLGYGVVFAVFSVLRNTFLLATWRAWESSIIDTILQRHKGFSGNRFLRAAVFFAFTVAAVTFTLWVHSGAFSDLPNAAAHSKDVIGLKVLFYPDGMWHDEITPLQTLGHLWDAFTRPARGTGAWHWVAGLVPGN